MCLPIKKLQEDWKRTHPVQTEVFTKYTSIEPHFDIVELIDKEWCQIQLDNMLLINKELGAKFRPIRFIGLDKFHNNIEHPLCYPIICTFGGDINISKLSFRVINRFLMSQILSHVLSRIVMNDINYIEFFKNPIQIESGCKLFKFDQSQLEQFDEKCECTNHKAMTIITFNDKHYLIDTALLSCLHYIKINQWLIKEMLIEDLDNVLITEYNCEKIQNWKQIWGVASSKVGTRVMFDLESKSIRTNAQTVKLSINFEFNHQVSGHSSHMFTLGGSKVKAIFRAIEPVVSSAAIVSTDVELFQMTMELMNINYNENDVEMLAFMIQPDIIKKALLFLSDRTVGCFMNFCDSKDMKIQLQDLIKKEKLEIKKIVKAFCDKEMQVIHFDDYCFVFSVLLLSGVECFGNPEMSINVGNGGVSVDHMIELNILAKSMVSYYHKFIDHDIFSFKYVDYHYQFD